MQPKASSALQQPHTTVLHPDGIIAISIRKVWTLADVDAFFPVLEPIHQTARRRYGRVRILVHVEEVQSPLVALHVRKHAVAIRQPGDRRAFVVATFLSKLQIRRLGNSESVGIFTDEAAARQWLLS